MVEIDRFYSTFYLFYNLQATVKGGHKGPPLPNIFGLQIIPQLVAQSILQLDEPFADVLGGLIGGGILIEIAAEGLDPHIAPIGHQVCNGGVRLVHRQLHIGLHPGHTLSHGVGVLALVPVNQ